MRNQAIAAALCTSMLWAADNPNRNFEVTFSGCTEYVAFGPIPYNLAQAQLPSGFIAASLGGDGGLVLRTSSCQAVSVAGSATKPGIVSHYGINIVSPDGTGDISNYTLLYATNSETLADQLRKAGMAVLYSPGLAAEDPSTLPGNMYASVFGDSLQPYFLTGPVAAPPGPPFPFLANWWSSSKTGRVKVSTGIPAIAFGAAGLVVNTSSTSPLGQLIGGNTSSNFPFYNVRGSFAAGLMTVTTIK